MSITWNGISSDTIGVIVERIPNRYVPTRRFSPQQVAGRNGNILLVDKSFPNVEQEYEVYLSAEAQGLPSVARACAEWLMGPDGYCRLEDSYDTTVYREAFLMGGYDLENILNKFGRCTITFSCKPQKYLLTGDTPIEIPAGITTYTGDVVQFDGVTGASITSLSTTITPTQDLHGYDNPWPAGGGKNKLNIDAISDTEGLVINDGSLVVTAPSGRDNITSVESLSDFADLVVGQQYTLTFTTTYSVGNYIYLRGSSEVWTNGGTKTITQAMLDGKVSFYSGVGGTATISNLMIRLSAETDATFAPYSNICPITGRTGVDVWDDPKYGGTVAWNQLNARMRQTSTQNGLTFTRADDGSLSISGHVDTAFDYNRVIITGTYIKYRRDGSKYLVMLNKPIEFNIGVNGYNDNLRAGNTAYIFTNADGGEWNNFISMRINLGYTVSITGLRVMVFDLTAMFGSTIADYIYSLEQADAGAGVAWFRNLFPKDYYPYDNSYTETCVSAVNGDPYWKETVDWTSEAGTVYGGTLDVVTGVLTVDRAMVDLGTLAWGKNWAPNADPTGVFYSPIISNIDINKSGICTSYAYATGNPNVVPDKSFTMFGAGRIFVKDTSYDDATNFKTAVSGVIVVYELATPLTYQLTAQEIEVLVEKNNVWASSEPVSVTVVAPFVGTVTNPTPFEARPMLEVSGVGEITINGKSIQILESVSDFQIDCEAMEAEDNSKIYCMDFPELSGGENEIVGDGSITALTVTPRWWIL